MFKELKKKVIVVTGSSSGIGRAIIERFAEEGASVVLNFLKDEETTLQLVEEIKNKYSTTKIIAVQGDISKEEDIIKILKQTIQEFGDMDVWINNAGIQKEVPTHELSKTDWDTVININLTGTFMASREAIKHFLSKGKEGKIINISSVHQQIPRPGYASYATSKGGLKMLTETLALEYGEKGIRVNSIAPGAIYTPINSDFEDPEVVKKVEDKIPLGYIAHVKDIANAAVWLASDQANYITGTTIFIDGGMTLYPSFGPGKTT